MWFLFEVIRYATMAYNSALRVWNWFWYPELDLKPHNRYFLSDTYAFDETFDRVPEDSVYIETWVRDGEKKCVVLYEGEEIPHTWSRSPFQTRPRCPWIWVGDRDTDIDLTRTFNKFLVVGNRITLDLVLKLIQITDRTNLVYIESKSFNELKFPGSGILIEADD